jgi:hypothetical protein
MAAIRHNLDLQERDLAIMQGLFESRVMTLQHMVSLYFEGRIDAARKRIQRLKACGYFKERPRRPYEPAVFYLTRKAFDTLQAARRLDKYPAIGWTALEKRIRVSDLTLRHELEVMDIKGSIAAKPGCNPVASAQNRRADR